MGTDSEINNVIFFDGVCNLCNSSVNFVIDRDPEAKFTFAPLQSDFAKNALKNEDTDSYNLESIVFLSNGKFYRRSRAALEIARRMRGAWPMMYVFIIVPGFVRDFIYNWIAKNRYKWFGKREFCRIPTPELKTRFVDS